MFGPKIYKGTKQEVLKAVAKVSQAGSRAANAVRSLAKHAELQEEIIDMYDNGYEREADAVLKKCAATREDLMDSVGLRVHQKQEALADEIEKTAEALANGDFSGVSQSNFVHTMAIAKLIAEKN